MEKQELIQLIEKTQVFKSFPVFKQILTLKKSNIEDLQDLLHQAEQFGIDYLKQNPRLQSTTVKLIHELLMLTNQIKMEKLTIKELAPYLPYGLKCQIEREFEPFYKTILQGLSTSGVYGQTYICPIKFNDCKPILRPLSDLTKEIEVNGEKIVPIEKIYDYQCWEKEELTELIESGAIEGIYSDVDLIPYSHCEKLFEWHFDVFGLIEKGLAIDINTLKS